MRVVGVTVVVVCVVGLVWLGDLAASSSFRRLSNWHYRFAYVPRSVLIQLCRDTTTKQVLNTSFAGGFILRKLGCITIEARIAGESRAHRSTVRIGVPRC